MAFSMFLRKSACTTSVFRQQVMRLATQPRIQHSVASTLPIRSLAKEVNTTPMFTALRSLRTSPALTQAVEEKPHDHAKLWVIERLTSAALVPLIPLALLMPCKILDSAMAILITAHTFWGLEAIVVEYIRTLIFGTVIPKIAIGIIYAITLTMLGGLYYLIYNDIGMARAFWRIWGNMEKPKRTGYRACDPDPGLEAIAVDYVRASLFGPIIPKIAIGFVYALSIATLGGLFYVISHDIGIANTVRAVWGIKSEQKA